MQNRFDELLRCLENGLDEHIHLLGKVNKGSETDTIDMYDYQTASESNEALVELRRLLTPNLNKKNGE